jgi:16S rRNA (cytosine967-C5)-methyltransferase
MRLHRNVALGILLGLENVLIKKRSASEVLKKLLRSNRSWGGKDRRTIGKIFYDIIRQKLFFEALTSTTENNHWPLLGCWMVLNEHQLPDWEEFENMNPTSLLAKAAVLSQQRRYRYSIPEWMDKMGVESMGEALWEKEMASLNTPAELVIRVNTLKLTVPKLKSILEKKI